MLYKKDAFFKALQTKVNIFKYPVVTFFYSTEPTKFCDKATVG